MLGQRNSAAALVHFKRTALILPSDQRRCVAAVLGDSTGTHVAFKHHVCVCVSSSIRAPAARANLGGRLFQEIRFAREHHDQHPQHARD